MKFLQIMAFAVFLNLSSVQLLHADETKQAIKAEEKISPLESSAECPLKETCTLSVNFNFMENNPRDAKNKMDKKSAEIEEIARKAGVQKFQLQNYNFNIHPQYNESAAFDGNMNSSGSLRYQVNGSLSYVISPSDKAITVMEQLLAMKIQSSLNVNAYSEGCRR